MQMKITALPTDVLGLVLAQLCLVRNIKGVKRTCHAFRAAAAAAEQARRRVCFEHAVPVTCCGSSARRVLTGSADKTVKVWRNGACERTIEAHTRLDDRYHEQIQAVAVLPGATRFVSCGSFDETAKLWTLDGALERAFAMDAGVLRRDLHCVAALPDGVHFVVGLGGYRADMHEVRLYHVDGTLVNTFTGHTDSVEAVAVTPGGQHIISGSMDRLVKVWSVATKSLVSTCEGHGAVVDAVAAMPDGQRILSGSRDSTVRVWLLNGTLENTFRLHAGYDVLAVASLRDNHRALSGSADNTVKLFNVNNGAVLRTFTHHTGPVNSLALLPDTDGLRFVSGSDDRFARIAEIW